MSSVAVADAHIGNIDGRFLGKTTTRVNIRRNALIIAFPSRTPLPTIS